jgi:hypothetical protein
MRKREQTSQPVQRMQEVFRPGSQPNEGIRPQGVQPSFPPHSIQKLPQLETIGVISTLPRFFPARRRNHPPVIRPHSSNAVWGTRARLTASVF